MEADEIGVVLSRASELHSKICDAIERALKAEGRSSSPTNGESADNPSPASPTSGRYGGNADASEQRGDGSAEARYLAAIRDALEVLEEQLEYLKTIQQQQRTEKDTALAELEESRRSLLTRLKDHRGKEWEVVHETLAFAGEPVEDRDDLRLPPYPMPLSDYSNVGDQAAPYHGQFRGKYNGALRNLSLGVGQSEDVENRMCPGESSRSDDEENQVEGRSFQAARNRGEGGGLLGIPWGFARACLAHAYGLTTKAAIVVACVAAALAINEAGQTLEKRRSTPISDSKTALPPITTARQMPPIRDCPPGKKLIIEDGYAKCVVKERVELPFPREIKTPDVLYGRG